MDREVANIPWNGAISSEYGKLKLASSAGAFRSSSTSNTAKAVSTNAIVSALIGVSEIQIRAKDGDGFLRFQIEPFTLDLMQLNSQFNGILARAKLPAGRYDLVRLITADRGRIFLTDGTQADLVIPSAAQSGLKVFFGRAIEIKPNQLTIASFDFDVSRSFVSTGQGYNFKPVVRPMCSDPIDLSNGGVSGSTGSSGSTDDSSSGDGSTDGSGTSTGTIADGSTPDTGTSDGTTGTIDPSSDGAVTPEDTIDDNYVPVLGN